MSVPENLFLLVYQGTVTLPFQNNFSQALHFDIRQYITVLNLHSWFRKFTVTLYVGIGIMKWMVLTKPFSYILNAVVIQRAFVIIKTVFFIVIVYITPREHILISHVTLWRFLILCRNVELKIHCHCITGS